MALPIIQHISRIAVASIAIAMAACGGSSSGDSKGFLDDRGSSSSKPIAQRPNPHPLAVWKRNEFEASSNFQHLCEKPRRGINPFTGEAYADKLGTMTDEKFYIRSLINETYLWYNEVDDVNPGGYANVRDYFYDLRTKTKTPAGSDKDKYHFVTDTATSEIIHSGEEAESHGLHYALYAEEELEIYVKYVDSQSPAELAGIKRGDRILSVDSITVSFDMTPDEFEKLDQALFQPSENRSVRLQLERINGDEYSAVLKGAPVAPTVVDKLQIFQESDQRVGYMLFNAFSTASEKKLYEAMQYLDSQNVTQLILDLRYNSGGYISIASQLGYMIAGSAQTQNKIFGQTQFNDKHPTIDPFTGETITDDIFYSTGLGFSLDETLPLPSLNLSRVYVITTQETCSASEGLINGLRGIGIEVIQIGSTTCGKPYGYYALDNCGSTYYFVQMKMSNALGYGDFVDGFTPSSFDDGQADIKGCFEADDLTNELGNRNEASLSQALHYIQYGSCKNYQLQRGATNGVAIAPLALPKGLALTPVKNPAATVMLRNRPN